MGAAFAVSQPLTFALRARHFESFAPPDPLDPFGVDLHTATPQQRGRHAVAGPRMSGGDPLQFRREDAVLVRLKGTAVLRAARLAKHPEGPACGPLEDRPKVRDRLAFARRAYHFDSAAPHPSGYAAA